MSEQPVNDDEQAEIKKRAMQRLAVAASLVATAVVVLTVLNHKKPEIPQPAPVSPTTIQTAEPIQPEEPVAEKPPEEEKPAATATEPAPPDTTTSPSNPPAPPPPQVFNQPQSSAHTSAKPRGETPSLLPKPVQPAHEAPSVEKPVSQIPVPQHPLPAARVTVEEKPGTTPHQAAKVAVEPAPAAKGYVVQLGLFSNPENALQLQKRLAEHGIKSYTETRLNVGPFQSKSEADQAMAKIRTLGINAVLAPVR